MMKIPKQKYSFMLIGKLWGSSDPIDLMKCRTARLDASKPLMNLIFPSVIVSSIPFSDHRYAQNVYAYASLAVYSYL